MQTRPNAAAPTNLNQAMSIVQHQHNLLTWKQLVSAEQAQAAS